MTIVKSLVLYVLHGGAAPVLMLGCAALAMLLVALKSLQLWLLLRPHDEQMETLEAISHVPSPASRLQMLKQLRQRMRGLEARLLDIVLTTPLGGVRSERLANELAYCRGRLEWWFALIGRLALAAPALGLVMMLYTIADSGAEPRALSAALTADSGLPYSSVLPLLLGTLAALPALLLLFIADHYWLVSLGQINRHSTRLSRLPTGLQAPLPQL
jgi:hypothetical protein